MNKINLVFSGSGTKFPVFAGAFKRYEEHMKQHNLQLGAVCGTSGGSIVAAAIGSGMNADQLIRLCKEIVPRLSGMVDYSLMNFVTNLGFIKDGPIHAELEKHFAMKFKEAKLPVYVVTVNFDMEEEEIFSPACSPDTHIWRAVAGSMAIPAVFPPVPINGDWHIDGGVMHNFAIDMFGNTESTVGFYFNDRGGRRKPRPKGWKKVAVYLSRVIDLLIRAKTEDDVKDAPSARAVPLTTMVGGLDFDFSPQEVDAMIKEGYDQVDAWLKKNKVI